MSDETLEQEFRNLSKEIEEIAKHQAFNGWMVFKNKTTIRSKRGFTYKCLYEIKADTLFFYIAKQLKGEDFYFSLAGENVPFYEQIKVHYIDQC